MKKHIIIGSIVLFLLAGCSEGSDKSGEQENAMSSLLSTHIEAVGKAEGVEQTIQDGFDKRDQMMDAQSQ